MSIPGQKIIFKNIFPIFIGGLISILLHLGLLELYAIIFSDLMGSVLIFVLIFYFIPTLTGCFITSYLSVKRNFIHSILAAIIFAIAILIPEIFGATIEFNALNRGETFFLLMLLVVVLAAILGSYIGIIVKRKKIVR